VTEHAVNQPFHVLAVCTGNLCRSPLIESLWETRADAKGGMPMVCASAGTRAVDGAAMDPLAAAELRRLGGDPSGLTSRDLRESDLAWADLVVTATREHRSHVLTMSPEHLHRAFTLTELAALLPRADGDSVGALVRDAARKRGTLAGLGADDLDLPDPIGRTQEVHAAVADRIDAAVESIVASPLDEK